MTHESELRQVREALNSAINNHDLETTTSFLHPDFVAQGTGGHSYNRQMAVQQLEQMLKSSFNLQSQIEVEHVEVSGDSAKLRVRRTESGRMYNPRHFWMFLAMAAMFAALAIHWAFRDVEQVPSQYWVAIVGYAFGFMLSIWLAFRGGLRSMHQTQRAEEIWRCVDGRWLLAEERQL
ncbi:MAG: nuclear transport factor 2 family protein [Planctomycetota bacterium]|nr:nuclear transport factor 2 family protein [Planctomycetota bacterium]